MNKNKYGLFYFEKKIVGYKEAKDKKEPIIKGDFVIKEFDDCIREREARESFTWYKLEHKDEINNKNIVNLSFVEIISKKGDIGNITYINKI